MMGLDIWLEKCPDPEEANRIEEEYESLLKEEEKNYDQMTEGEKKDCRNKAKQLAEEIGLDEFGTHKSREAIEIDSAIDSEHLFKIGYFRSSYNNSGINSVFRKMGLEGMEYIFDYNEDVYRFTPNWKESAERVSKLIAHFTEATTSDIGQYRAFEVSHNPFIQSDQLPASEKEAMELFAKELSRETGDFRAYSNGAGEFYLDGQKVYGLIPGKKESFLSKEEPCFYIILENTRDSIDWYKNALLIVKETIEYVLSQEDSDTYYLRWSG